LGKFYYLFSRWAIGEDDSEVTTEESDLKSVGNSTTLLHDINDYDEIKRNIEKLSRKVSKRAMESELYGFRVTLTIRFQDFKTITRSITLSEPINDYEGILINALKLLDINYDDTKLVRLLGVSLGEVKRKDHLYRKISLFDNEISRPVNPIIKQVIDDINKKIGDNLVTTLNHLKEGDLND
jgi:DNA polymerase-4